MIAPSDFEKLVVRLMRECDSRVDVFEVNHLERISADDGEYEFDATARFRFVGGDYLVVIECKRMRRPIERSVVQVLRQKQLSVGAHKSMLFSTSYFRRGAIDFADKNGMALVRVRDESLGYVVRNTPRKNDDEVRGGYSLWRVTGSGNVPEETKLCSLSGENWALVETRLAVALGVSLGTSG